MNVVYMAQVVGTISILLLFLIKFYIAVSDKAFKQAGRVAILWTSIYVLFLFILRLLSLLGVGTLDQLRIISGFSSVIPLVATVIQLFLNKKAFDEFEEQV